MSRQKKKHVCSCGEEFPHGIGLRKHQRDTDHKGSTIVVDDGSGLATSGGGEAEESAPAPATPPPARRQTVLAQPEPEPEESEPPPSPAAPPTATVHQPYEDDDEEDYDTTVPVVRQAPQSGAGSWQTPTDHGPSRFQQNKQKVSLVARGLRILLGYRARSAGNQLKQSARSGADIFAEAFKIAISLLLIIAIPIGAYLWWRGHRTPDLAGANVPTEFQPERGALAARSALLMYLDNLAKGEYSVAYAMLSPAWRSEMSEESFRETFLGIENIRWAVNGQKLLNPESAEVSLVIAYIEDGRPRRYRGRFRLTQQAQLWKVDRLELSSIPST